VFHNVVVCFFVQHVDTKIAHWVLEIFLKPYSRKICTFYFGDRHLGVLADVDVTRYRKWHAPSKSSTPKIRGYIAVGILLLCALELKIYLGGKIPPSYQQTSKKQITRCRDNNQCSIIRLYSLVFARRKSSTDQVLQRTMSFKLVADTDALVVLLTTADIG